MQAGSGQAVSSEAVSFIFEVLEPEIFAQCELDMEVVYEDGEWELLSDEANERELSLIKPFSVWQQRARVFPQMHPMGS